MIAQSAAAMGQILDILAEPKAAFRRILDGGVPWVFVGAVVCACMMILQISELPVAFARMPAGVSPAALHTARTWMSIAIAATPLVFAARVAIAAYAIWIGAALSDLAIPYVRCVALVVCAQTVVLLHQAVMLVLVKMSGAAQMPKEIGLNLLFNGQGFLAHVAAVINPFSVWYLALLVGGVAFLGRTGARRGAITLVPYVALVLAFQIGTAYFAAGRGF